MSLCVVVICVSRFAFVFRCVSSFCFVASLVILSFTFVFMSPRLKETQNYYNFIVSFCITLCVFAAVVWLISPWHFWCSGLGPTVWLDNVRKVRTANLKHFTATKLTTDYSKCYARLRDTTSNFSWLITWKKLCTTFSSFVPMPENQNKPSYRKDPTITALHSNCWCQWLHKPAWVHVWALFVVNSTFLKQKLPLN